MRKLCNKHYFVSVSFYIYSQSLPREKVFTVVAATNWFYSQCGYLCVTDVNTCVFQTATTEQTLPQIVCVCAEPAVGVRQLNAIKHVVLTSVLCLLIPHYGANKPAWTLCHSQSR